MRRFPVRVLSVALLAFCLAVLPTMAAQAAPWSLLPVEAGWWIKVEALVARALARWTPAEAGIEGELPRQRPLTKEGATIDPDGTP